MKARRFRLVHAYWVALILLCSNEAILMRAATNEEAQSDTVPTARSTSRRSEQARSEITTAIMNYKNK